MKVNPYNYAGRFPTVTFGFSAAAPAVGAALGDAVPRRHQRRRPGHGQRPPGLPRGHRLAGGADVPGRRTPTSGFVRRHTRTTATSPSTTRNVYIQDNWRGKPGLTIRGGIKWEYFSPLREDDNLAAAADAGTGQSTHDALLNPAGTVDFVNGGMYGGDQNNFGPTVGFAWDPSKNGRTVGARRLHDDVRQRGDDHGGAQRRDRQLGPAAPRPR